MTQIVDLGKLRFYFAGSWNSATEYELNDVVRYGGNVYVYTNALATTGNLPTTTSHWSLLVSGFNFEGAWNSSTAYQINDAVTYGAKMYRALGVSTGSIPGVGNANWEIVADGIQYEGTWASGASYQKDDIVTYGGSAYIALRDTVGDQPNISTQDWDKLVDGTYPDQSGKANYILKTDGTEAIWTNIICFYLS